MKDHISFSKEELGAFCRKQRAPTLFDLVGMEQELSALLGGRKADLRTPGDLSRYFRQQALEEAEVQYAAG